MVTDEELGKKLLVLNLIWLAILISLAVYLFVGLWVAPGIQTGMNEKTLGILRQALYLMSIITFIATRFVKKLMLSAKGQHPVLQKYMVAMIVTWALSESIAIYGLVLYLLGKNTSDLYLLVGVSALALFLYRPSRDEAAELVRNNTGEDKNQ